MSTNPVFPSVPEAVAEDLAYLVRELERRALNQPVVPPLDASLPELLEFENEHSLWAQEYLEHRGTILLLLHLVTCTLLSPADLALITPVVDRAKICLQRAFAVREGPDLDALRRKYQ